MLLELYLENIVIYGQNLSFIYVFCALVSFLAVWCTWYREPSDSTLNSKDQSETSFQTLSDSETSLSSKTSNDRKALLKSIESSLSVDDIEKENKTEKEQLMEIFELMRQDEKFDSVTIEELEDQLKLYR